MVPAEEYTLTGKQYLDMSAADANRLRKYFKDIIELHNPDIRRIIRRDRQWLETHNDPITREPYLKKISVELYGEGDGDAILLPAYLMEAYQLAEQFCELVGKSHQNAGFLRTLVLRRLGSSLAAGINTVRKFLGQPPVLNLAEDPEEGDDAADEQENPPLELSSFAQTLTPAERAILKRMLASLEAFTEKDPKFLAVLRYLKEEQWIDAGCIIFSQYRDSIYGLGMYLSGIYPEETIALYSGSETSGLLVAGVFKKSSRELIKKMVKEGKIRLLLGTDAASEGLNLQRLGTQINLDLPWNPTRLEQRKGRIQRIGQLRDTVKVYNMRYKDSVEDRVHELLSERLNDIFNLFGQLPDVLEDVWVNIALGKQQEARQVIDLVPREHPFTLKNTEVQPVDWESCGTILSERDMRRVLSKGWAG